MITKIKKTRSVKIELTQDEIRDAIMGYLIENYGHPLTAEDIEAINPNHLSIWWDDGDEGGFAGAGYRPEGIRVDFEMEREITDP